MRNLCVAGAFVLALGLPQAADAQNNGRGNDSHAGKDHGRGGGDDRGRGQENRGNSNRGHDNRGQDNPGRGRGDDNRGGGHDDRGGPPGQQARNDNRGRDNHRDVRVVNGNSVRHDEVFRDVPGRGLIAGCPPGLARKDNGCLPPGQARKVDRVRYDYLWDRRDDDFVYRYDDGYLDRLSRQGSLLGYLPVLGGALGLGNVWPAQYTYQPAPAYYVNYYGLNDSADYRYADGVLYQVDPTTQLISSVAALLTGQQWSVGQQMPTGYDIYNVPYAYRDQYVDGPDRMYRYNDGYVYQVDPTTQLVQAVIQLLV